MKTSRAVCCDFDRKNRTLEDMPSGMDSLAPPISTTPTWSFRVAAWVLSRGRAIGEADRLFRLNRF